VWRPQHQGEQKDPRTLSVAVSVSLFVAALLIFYMLQLCKDTLFFLSIGVFIYLLFLHLFCKIFSYFVSFSQDEFFSLFRNWIFVFILHL